MDKERQPYSFHELNDLLERVRLGEECTLNIPSAFLCLVNRIFELEGIVTSLESQLTQGITLVNGDQDEL